jgi:hypothetical protein
MVDALVVECEAKLKELIAAEVAPVKNAELIQRLRQEWFALDERLLK